MMAENNNLNQDDLMVIATWMYYRDDLTHQQIAKELSLSRVAVTRLLQKARRHGLVQFKITQPLPLHYDLSQQLIKTFDIQKVIIVKTLGSRDETLDAIGRAAAEHMKEVIYQDCRLGFGWSTTVSCMAPYLEKPDNPVNVFINELAGSMLGQKYPYSISSRVAETVEGVLEHLPVPVIVNNQKTYQALMEEQLIKTALTNASKCDIAFVGLGDMGPECTMIKTGYLTPEQMDDLKQKGAVGDILLRYYDIDGKQILTPLDPNIISLEWEQIIHIPYTVALASGLTKVDTILGALQGGFIDCLVSDTQTIQQVLKRYTEIPADPT
ncbi:MAG: hypothetical protein IMY80_04285 [Chloroflexi bacterium]|nr:hypothetical protein [Chloroflexota bacterium]